MAENTEPRIGVFVCHCGTNIAGSMSIDDVVNYAKTLPYVAVADQYQYMCSTPGQKKIDDAITEDVWRKPDLTSSCSNSPT